MIEDLSLSIEDPRDADGAALIAEMAAFIQGLYPEDVDEAPTPWTTADLAREGLFIVARVDGSAAGCGGLAPSDGNGALELVRMYVRSEYRARHIADRLLAELERLATLRESRLILLRCGPRQPEALKLYERHGYARRAVFGHHRDRPTNVFYEKQLAPVKG